MSRVMKRKHKRSQHYRGNRLSRKVLQRDGRMEKKYLTDNSGSESCASSLFMEIGKVHFKLVVFVCFWVKGYVGGLCVISDNPKIAWAAAFKGNNPEAGERKTKWINAGQTFDYYEMCRGDREKVSCEGALCGEWRWNSVQGCVPRRGKKKSYSGVFRENFLNGQTKVRIVEQFNRTLKNPSQYYLKLIDKQALNQKAW